jgi:hypothetical protein
MDAAPEIKKIELEQETLNYLNTTRKWSMFLAISGFIFIGLIIVIGVIAGTFLTAFNTGESGLGFSDSLMVGIFLAIAIIYFFPVLFLFRFSKHTALAVKTLNKQELHKAFKNLKYFFGYIATLLIICFTLYLTVLILAGTSMAFLKELV